MSVTLHPSSTVTNDAGDPETGESLDGWTVGVSADGTTPSVDYTNTSVSTPGASFEIIVSLTIDPGATADRRFSD